MAFDKQALLKAVHKGQEMITSWVGRWGKAAEQQYSKYTRLYTAWGLAAYSTQGCDILIPHLLNDMEVCLLLSSHIFQESITTLNHLPDAF